MSLLIIRQKPQIKMAGVDRRDGSGRFCLRG
jgi:hypothetical protein